MSRRPSPAAVGCAALACAALLALAGCGAGAEPTAVDAGSDPTTAGSLPTGDTPTSSDASAEPSWPAVGCESRASSSFDYRREPKGWKTPEEAVAHTELPGLPDGTLVLAPAEPHTQTQVWVVDEATGTILASVSVFPGSTGFYVDGVTTCA